MSSYSEKRHRVDCAIARCTDSATQLKLIGGKPQWVCALHAEKINK